MNAIPYSSVHIDHNTRIVDWLTSINHPSKPQTKMKLKCQHILYILRSLFTIVLNTKLLSCIILFPFLCQSAAPASMTHIDELINSGTARNGELCNTMGNCEYLTTISTQQDSSRGYMECPSDTVCILICDQESPCKLLDVFAETNSILIIDCIDIMSCDELSVHGKEAYFVYVEGNDQHSIFKSQVQCPMDTIIETNQPSCIVHGNCIDIDGKSHCRQDFIDPMISWLSIYSYKGYNDLELKCDQNDEKHGSWCFDDNNFILCGSANAQQTCWIDYDIDHNEYICDGDASKCRDDINHNIDVTNASPYTFIERISSNTHILYLVIAASILFCGCCIFCVAVCTYSAYHQRIKNKKNNRHRILSFEKQDQTCLCCCCDLKDRRPSEDADTGSVDTEQPQITVTIDHLSIKPLQSLFQTSNTIETMSTNEAQTDTLQIKYTAAQDETQGTPDTTPIHKEQQSSSSTHLTQNTSCTFDHSNDTNTLNGVLQMKQPSLKSHTDGKEAQAAKILCDAKLGYKANSTSYKNYGVTSYTYSEFDYNHNAFGVASDSGFVMDEDYKLALQIQQEQLYKAVKGHTHIKSIQKSNKSKSRTPHYDNNNNDTPYKKETSTPNETLTHKTSDGDQSNNNKDNDDVLDLGGGFKIGVNEESDSPIICNSSYSDSTSSFDPEHPNDY